MFLDCELMFIKLLIFYRLNGFLFPGPPIRFESPGSEICCLGTEPRNRNSPSCSNPLGIPNTDLDSHHLRASSLPCVLGAATPRALGCAISWHWFPESTLDSLKNSVSPWWFFWWIYLTPALGWDSARYWGHSGSSNDTLYPQLSIEFCAGHKGSP